MKEAQCQLLEFRTEALLSAAKNGVSSEKMDLTMLLGLAEMGGLAPGYQITAYSKLPIIISVLPDPTEAILLTKEV